MAEWPGQPVEEQWPGQVAVETPQARRLPEQAVDLGQLTNPHEVEFVQGRRGQMSNEDMAEAIRQFRAIQAADEGVPTAGTTAPPTMGAIRQAPTIPATPSPVESQAVAQPSQSLLRPHLTMEDLRGPVGQGALASGLAAMALTPPPFQPLGFIAGGVGSLLAEEGTRRLQEQLGEVPGGLAGLAASIISGGGVGRVGRLPSKLSPFPAETSTSTPTIPSLKPTTGLYETIPRGGAYSSQELLTEPSSRIGGGTYGEGQFTTGSGEPLFGQVPRIEPEIGTPFVSKPVTIPPALRPPLQEKLPTIEQKPIPHAQLELERKVRSMGIDMGTKGPGNVWNPPKDYVSLPTPSRWKQLWNVEKQRWGQELPVLQTQPNSPVISAMEGSHVAVEDFMENYVHQPWLKGAFKMGDNTKLAPLEEQWVKQWKAGQDPTNSIPADIRRVMQRRKELLDGENAIRLRRGLDPIPEVKGPYLPRITDEDFQLMRSISRSHEGAKTAQSVGPFAQERVYESLAEGLAKGVTYKDWRWATLMREARGAVLRATDQMMTDLEGGNVIFKTKEAAESASLTGKAYPAEGLPFPPEGGSWWVRSAEERQFLLQNMRQLETGTLANIRGWAQQFLRNPSLINPWPHIMKNMALKQMQQAVVGGLNPAKVLRNTAQYRWGKPDMIDEFKQVMPFTESGHTVWELMERAAPQNMVQQLSRVPGVVNMYARKKIFAEWDPAMRYGLWREYVRKGMTPQEAANHTWIDLIRYGTRSDRIDAWNSVPFNFFVPWRVGTLRTMNKALQTSPVRMGLFMGAVDALREMDYRYNGRWTHLPYDYIERPLMTLMMEGKEEALSTLAATIIAGPGGEYMFRTIQNMINDIEGKGGLGDLRTLGWGLAQVYDLWPQYNAYLKDGKASHITDMLGLALIGRHATPYGAPHRLGELIPESIIPTNPNVKDTEALREAIKAHSDVKQKQKFYRDVERYKQPMQPQTR